MLPTKHQEKKLKSTRGLLRYFFKLENKLFHFSFYIKVLQIFFVQEVGFKNKNAICFQTCSR